VLSTPSVAGALLAWIEFRDPPDLEKIRQSHAILFLDGGAYAEAPGIGQK
jgi:hypothetical protein